jgi:hypothetical protein
VLDAVWRYYVPRQYRRALLCPACWQELIVRTDGGAYARQVGSYLSGADPEAEYRRMNPPSKTPVWCWLSFADDRHAHQPDSAPQPVPHPAPVVAHSLPGRSPYDRDRTR